MSDQKMTGAASYRALAQAFLNHVPSAQRQSALDDLSSQLTNQNSSDAEGDANSIARLVVEILEVQKSDLASSRLQNYVVNALSPEAADQNTLAELLASSPSLCNVVLERIKNHLSLTLDLLIVRADVEGFAVPSAAILHCQPEANREDIDHVARDAQGSIELCEKYLVFLKNYFWTLPAIDDGTVSSLLRDLLSLLGASNKLAGVANQTLSALFLILKDRGSQGNGSLERSSSQDSPVQQLVWDRLQDLTSSNLRPASRNFLYQTWLRWTILPSPVGPKRELLSTDRYWMDIQNGLRNGSTEEKKVCLTILKASLDLLRQGRYDVSTQIFSFDSSKSAEYITAYTKFCTLFESIVIGRYLNQVEESLPELTPLASPPSRVHDVWINALLTAALNPNHAESLRKRVSTWYTDQGAAIFKPTADHLHFFQTCFLPWAGIPQHFTKDSRRYNHEAKSEYGQQLSRLVFNIITGCSNLQDKQASVRAVLAYLRFKDSGSFPYTDIYMLEGIIDGLKGEKCLSYEDAPNLIGIAVRSELPAARDLMHILCMELLRSCQLGPDQRLESIRGFSAMTREYESILHTPPADAREQLVKITEGLDGVSDIPSLNLKLSETSHSCIQGRGLVDGFDLILDTLSSCADSNELFKAIDAVWNELERQYHPRDAIMKVPQVIFHQKTIDAALENPELLDLVSRIRDECWEAVKGRVYLFPVFARGLRDAYFRSSANLELLRLEEFMLDFLNHPPSPRPEYVLERAVAKHVQSHVPSRGFSFYYGREPGYGFACMFDTLNRIRETDLGLVRTLLDELLRPLLKQKPPVPSVSAWKTTEQFQALVFLVEALLPTWETSERLHFIRTFTDLLAYEPLPRYRFLYEWILCRLYIQTSAGHDDLLTRLEEHDEGNPQLYASLIRISVTMAQLPEMPEAFFTRVVLMLFTYATNPKVVTRHESQRCLPALWDSAVAQRYQIKDNPAFAAVNSYIRTLEKYKNPPRDRMLEWLNPFKDQTLTLIFQGQYLEFEPPDVRIALVRDFQDLWEDDQARQTSYPHDARIPLGTPRVGWNPNPRTDSNTPPEPPSQPGHEPFPSAEPAATGPLQTKSSAWQDTLLSSTRPHTPLVLVGSLIDNPHNLGGLARCAEVFGCAQLVLRDPGVVANKQFTLVSVSAHLHLPLEAVRPEDLGAFLVARKRAGYTVVGVEQTDRSRVLGRAGTLLPAKTVLVMGSEKEGIPAEILVECDVCIEVRQMGVTRSLNVQTAASIALFEYARQHALSVRNET